PDLARTLDFEEEGIDRAVDPDQLQTLAGQSAVLDLGAAVAARVWRTAVERRLERPTAVPRPVQRDLEIAGEEPLGAAIIAGQHRGEAGFEKAPRGGVIARQQRRGGVTGRPPIPDAPEIRPAEARLVRAGVPPRVVGFGQVARAGAQKSR